MSQKPNHLLLAPNLEICRLVTGLWQIADMEKDGRKLDLDALARDMVAYAREGFDTFDMADHYGSAEDIAPTPPRARATQSQGMRPRIRTCATPIVCPGEGPPS